MKKWVGLIGLCLFGLVACDDRPAQTTDRKMQAQQEKIQAEGAAQVGMPGISRFTEKRLVSRLYEKRDQEKLLTYTYLQDMNGRLHHLCNSIGYGLPYGVQFSNPHRIMGYNETPDRGNITIDQAEPNGLYMPPTAEGTWVDCIGPKGEDEPLYIEPRVITSPWPLAAVDSYQK